MATQQTGLPDSITAEAQRAGPLDSETFAALLRDAARREESPKRTRSHGAA